MNDIDKAVGNRIKARRKALKLSQTDLANCIGVKFQQVQKYESGSNRVAASRLWQMAEALQVHVSYFFDDLEFDVMKKTNQTDAATLDNQFDILRRSLDCITEPQRNAILALIETFEPDNSDQKSI